MRLILNVLLLFCGIILNAQNALCVDFLWSGDVTLFHGYRVLRENNTTDYYDIDDNVGVFGLGLKTQVPNFTFDVKGRVVGGYGDGLHLPPNDPAYLDLSSPRRFFKWESRSTNKEVFSDVEKAYLLFQYHNFEFSVGRRAVGIGTLKHLPIWNRFVPSVAHLGGPALIHNPDDIQMSYQYKQAAFSGYHVQRDTSQDNISLVINTWYLDWIELHLLAGYWWERDTGGLAFVKDYDGLTVRAESLFFRDKNDLGIIDAQIGVGLEYAFNSKWSIVSEGLYSSIGAANKDEYLFPNQERDKFAILNANSYLYTSIDYTPFDFWKVSAGSLVNLMDSSYLVIGNVKYSWSDSLDISAEIKQPVGTYGQEFGSDFYIFSDDVYFGYSQQFSLQLNYYF